MSAFEVDPSPGNDQGAIWMGGGAPVVDGSGNIWVASGNGSNTAGTSPDYSDSVIELSPTLSPVQTFTPTTWATDNQTDADLGSSPPALLSDGLAFQAGKSGNGYLLNQSSLGGTGGQQAQLSSFCASFGGDAFSGHVVYVPCLSGLAAVQENPSPPSLSVAWRSSSGTGGPPIIAGGLVWTINRTSGILYGLDPLTGNAVTNVSLGAMANHFPTPSYGDGLLLAASSNQVHAFTLTP
jgi:hypothetical protein